MVEPIIAALTENLAEKNRTENDWILDCTLGGGGHTSALLKALEKISSPVKVLAIDQDAGAIERARNRFSTELSTKRLELIHCRMSEVTEHLKEKNIVGIMADLGFSSDQLEDPARGISFQWEGPLDMRLDPSRGMPVRHYLQTLREKEIADILWQFGEERFSRKIAAKIVAARAAGNLPHTTLELAGLIESCYPPPLRHGRIHAATRSFQALRIFVNDELGELESLLKRVILEVKSGGRIAILSFHSLEDREVKHRLRDKEVFRALTKKPIEADEAEQAQNPRSRSAKLRIAERV